jgi:LysR family transcriptional regulator, nod-box dependent transcriptional activator
MNRFNFNLFFALDAILHAKTLTEAANNVHLSQPAMSVSLKKLRAYFKDDLVVYSSNGTHLTALAEAIKPRIRAVLHEAREALELSLDFDPASDTRTFSVTAPDVVELIFLRKAFARIASEAPNVECMSIPFPFKPVDQLFQQQLDVAVISEAFALPEYPREHLYTDTISCMVWSGNEDIGDTMTERQFFEGRHAAMYYAPEPLTHPVGAALHAIHLKRRIAVRASVYSALPHMIIGTDMIVTTLTRYANFCAETLPVRVVPNPIEMPEIPFVAQWQEYRSTEPVIKWLVGHLKEAAADL